jgi:hypothetical protein
MVGMTTLEASPFCLLLHSPSAPSMVVASNDYHAVITTSIHVYTMPKQLNEA